MLTVRLHGHLEEKFGTDFMFEAHSVREAIDALRANFESFTEEFIKDERAYHILVDNDSSSTEQCFLPVSSNSTIDIVPVISGSGNFLKALGIVVLGIALIAFAPALATGISSILGVTAPTTVATIATSIAGIGVSLIVAGVASLLYKEPKDSEGGSSSNLGKGENIVGQGMPVPLGYGKFLTGSAVISATYVSSKLIEIPAWTYDNLETGVWNDASYVYKGPIVNDELYYTWGSGGFIFNRGLTAKEIKEIQKIQAPGTATYHVRDPVTGKGYIVPLKVAALKGDPGLSGTMFQDFYVIEEKETVGFITYDYRFSRSPTQAEFYELNFNPLYNNVNVPHINVRLPAMPYGPPGDTTIYLPVDKLDGSLKVPIELRTNPNVELIIRG